MASASVPLMDQSLFGKAMNRKFKNWVWATIDTRATDDEWEKRFTLLKKAHIDALILEIYNGRYAYFGSERLPVKEEYLERIIPIARSAGLEIHAWMWALPCMLQNVQEKHPDWYMVNGLGDSALTKPAYVDYYKFLCPAKEEVQMFVKDTAAELLKYDVDGIHLDYIRYPDVILAKGFWPKYNIIQDREYPQYDYCYCETCRGKYISQSGIDPLDIKEPAADRNWRQFRYDQVTHLVNDVLIPAAHKAGKRISAAVFPNWQNVRQQWPQWKLDAVMPMLYNRFYLSGADWIYENTKKGRNSLTNPVNFYSGLLVDEPEKFKKYIIKAFEGGAQGISIFSLNTLKETHYKILTEMLKDR